MKKESLIRKAKKFAHEDKMPEGFRYMKNSACSRITDVEKVGDTILVADRHGCLYKVTEEELEEMVAFAEE